TLPGRRSLGRRFVAALPETPGAHSQHCHHLNDDDRCSLHAFSSTPTILISNRPVNPATENFTVVTENPSRFYCQLPTAASPPPEAHTPAATRAPLPPSLPAALPPPSMLPGTLLAPRHGLLSY